MNAIVERLVVVLRAEEELYERMRDLLQTERGLMLELDPVGLDALVREKEILTDEGRLIEDARSQIVVELGAALGLGSQRPSLSELCAALGADGGVLREAHTRLVVLVSVVQELLDANRILAGESLDQVQSTLRLLGSLSSGSPEAALRPDAGRLLRRTA